MASLCLPSGRRRTLLRAAARCSSPSDRYERARGCGCVGVCVCAAFLEARLSVVSSSSKSAASPFSLPPPPFLARLQPQQKPVVLKKSVNGFLVNRLQYALLQEAWRLVEVSARPNAVAHDGALKGRRSHGPVAPRPLSPRRTALPRRRMWTAPSPTALACAGPSWAPLRPSSSTPQVRGHRAACLADDRQRPLAQDSARAFLLRRHH